MQTQILFVQGGGEGAHDEWDQKLVDDLSRHLGADYEIRFPLMPNEADPHFESWKDVLAREIAELDDGAILIGHSIGGTMLINALAGSIKTSALGGIILIAVPFIGKGGWPSDEIKADTKLGKRLPSGVPVHLFHGGADETAPASHAELYKTSIPSAVVHFLPGRDHQLNNDLTEVAKLVRALA